MRFMYRTELWPIEIDRYVPEASNAKAKALIGSVRQFPFTSGPQYNGAPTDLLAS